MTSPLVALAMRAATLRAGSEAPASAFSEYPAMPKPRRSISGIAAGLYLGGARPTVMLQSSGLGNSLNAITSLLVPYKIPVLMVISMRGDAGEWNDAQVPMGRAVRPICDAIGVPHVTVGSGDRAQELVALAGRTAFGTRIPGACLLPRRVTAPTAQS